MIYVYSYTLKQTKPPARKTKSAAKSKVAATTTDDDEGTSSKPTRRAAKAADSGASATEDSQAPAPPAKSGRKTQTRIPETQAIAATAMSESEPEPVVKKAGRKGRAGAKITDDESAGSSTGTGKRGTRAKPVSVDEIEEDPLDSIGTSDEPPVPVTKGRRGARSRTTTAETAKDKESEEEATSGTGKKTSAKKSTKVSGRKAAVAPATPALTESENGVDKENTPSVEDEALVKPKATRAKKGTKTTVAEEMDVDAEVSTAKPRATRTTRARK
jgi:hypothetical protein